ncbi:MAG: adenylate/guanylate cyclase domain-containing protein [Acidimicrobiales bacterium]
MNAASGSDLFLPYLTAPAVAWARDEAANESATRSQSVAGTMVFGDISGFTKMSERLARHGKVGAEEVADAINTCFEQLLDAAYKLGGSLLKFGGDAMLLLFTGPDHAIRAAHAAIGMRSRLRSAGRLHTTAGEVVLRISVGVHSGTFDLFLVGDSHRELVVAGPDASTTVDAEATASAGEIVMSAQTAALLPARARGPACGAGYLLRSPGGPPPRMAPKRPDPGQADISRFVPAAIRRHLVEGGEEHEHRTATVAFLHFDGIDDLVTELGIHEVARQLDAVVRAAQAAADSHQVSFLGTDIDKDGGKIILTAGVPSRAGDDEQRMLLAVRQVLDQQLPLHLRVGVNTGPVFAGDIGTPFRRTFTVMGDTVNLAARLMARAEPDQVLVTKETLSRSDVQFVAAELPPFTVKGKRRPVQAFAVGAPDRAHRSVTDRLPLTGREEEVAVLREAVRAASTGAGRVVELVGDHGSGKSRLAEVLVAESETLPTFTIVCEPYESATPYATFNILGRALVGVEMDAAAETVRQNLVTYLEREAPDLRSDLSLLATVIGLDLPDPPALAALEPEFRRQAVAEASAHLFCRALGLPRVLVIEDAQHMDPASQQIMGIMVRNLAERPGAICITRRETDGGFSVDEAPHTRSVLLAPLTSIQAKAALIAATEDEPLLPHEIQFMADRSMGNPLFLEELWRSRRDGAGIEALPDSVDAAVGVQIDSLRARDRRILRSASVLGSVFFERDLRELLEASGLLIDDGLDPGARSSALPRSLDQFLTTDSSGLVRFSSALVRECAYEGLPYRRRRELHGRAAERLEARGGTESDAEVLSLHYFYAQQFAAAWHHARTAARNASDKYANVESARLYERALACTSHIDDLNRADVASAWEMLGDVRERAGDFKGGAAAYRRAGGLTTEVVAKAELCLKEAWMAERLGQFPLAVRWIRRGLRAIANLDNRPAGQLRAQLMTWYTAVRQAQGRSSEAVVSGERAVAEARTWGNRKAEAHALSLLDWALVSLGRAGSANHSEDSVAIYRELGDLGGEAQVLNNMGGFAYFRGAWDEAVSFYRQAQDIRLRTGNEVEAAICTFNIGEILSDQGHFDEARPHLDEALRVLRAARYSWGIGYAMMLIGRLESRTGSFDSSWTHFESSLRAFHEVAREADAFQVESLIAESLVFQGRATEALDIAVRLAADVARVGSAVGNALVERVRGYALAQLGDLRSAGSAFEASRTTAEELGADYELMLTLDAMRSTGVSYPDGHSPEELTVRIDELRQRLGIVVLPVVPMTAAGSSHTFTGLVGSPS